MPIFFLTFALFLKGQMLLPSTTPTSAKRIEVRSQSAGPYAVLYVALVTAFLVDFPSLPQVEMRKREAVNLRRAHHFPN